MRNLIAGFILIVILPAVGTAQTSTGVERPRNVLEPSPETGPAGPHPPRASEGKNAGSAGTQGDAYAICMRATQRFDEQEKAKGNEKTEVTSLSTACQEELKPAAYWLCMDKKALEQVDFNSADWQCARQTGILK
ncbi:hypothetical protein [Candidatus Methylomicrobium oryzae]|jgi:hypothetical protein|uniref:hypothetical protein n=1 Tax=Candidatus Methylomicrobium oryzae TaxID=2802053 RepID=UPI001921C037|nr:hypothetical protein [Methylomicrobium sp. RS1]MBL1262284.1 hypothetical protein [Methylomicrobium sp. RS1]